MVKTLKFCVVALTVTFILIFISSRVSARESKQELLMKEMCDGYNNYSKEISVEKLGIDYITDRAILSESIQEVINSTTDVFYAGRTISYTVNPNTRKVLTIKLSYDERYLSNGQVNKNKIIKVKKQINTKIKKIIKTIPKNATDVEKALLLHDYLVENVYYIDSESQPARISEEGAILKGKANCMGYALAYISLLRKTGIEAKCVSSNEMQHMWNLVKINGKWYHVDVTWDDPISTVNRKDMKGKVKHSNFLCSDSAISMTGHHGFETEESVTSTVFDNAYWRKVNSKFIYYKNKYIYCTEKGLYSRKKIFGGSKKRIKKGDISVMINRSSSKIIYVKKYKVYELNLKNNKERKIYSGKSGYSVSQLQYNTSNKKLYVWLYKNKKYKLVKKVV